MKLFLSGAQGTGKSSIIKHLEENNLLPNIKFFDSYSKLFLKTKDEQKVTHPNFLPFQNKIIVYSSNVYLNENNFISSRSFADSYAYLTYAIEESKEKGYVNYLNNLNNLLEGVYDCVNVLKKEENIYHFYTPIEFEISSNNNDLRLTNKEFQINIDNKIKDFYKIANIKPIMLTGSVEERIKSIISLP